jgi:hypothetical protein|tara:strand:- start:692 stop:832 length:141 start_codon:yes stop_codon:yes gene_type:complete
MGCGCNKAKAAKETTTVARVKRSIQKIWENTQTTAQPVVVKRINKK